MIPCTKSFETTLASTGFATLFTNTAKCEASHQLVANIVVSAERATTTTKLGLQNAELGSVINSFLSSATAKLVISWPVLRHIFAVVTL